MPEPSWPKTPEQYEDSLRKMNFKIYLMGELVKNWVDHPIIRPSMNAVKMTYELAQKLEHEDLMTVKIPSYGNKIQPLHTSASEPRRSGKKSQDAASAGTEDGSLFSAMCRHGCHERGRQHRTLKWIRNSEQNTMNGLLNF